MHGLSRAAPSLSTRPSIIPRRVTRFADGMLRQSKNVSRLSWPAHESLVKGVNHAGAALTIHRDPQGAWTARTRLSFFSPPPLTRLAFIKMVCPP
jgi:hypothetical protein